MEEGFTLDHDHGQRRVAEWVSGAPLKSFWLGVRLKDRVRRKIQTWRCERCGLLEGYAPDV